MGTTLEDVAMDYYVEDEAFADLVYEKMEERDWENIRDYFLKNNGNTCVPIIDSLEMAKNLFGEGFYTSSLIHSNIAIELIIRTMLISPILGGSIFDEVISDLVATEILSNRSISGLDRIVRFLVNEKTYIDLDNYKDMNIWQKIMNVRKIRNKVMHRGGKVDRADADLALKIVEIFFNEIVGELLKSFKLEIKEKRIIGAL